MNQNRIQSIDVLRGAVMVLMAIDHVRVYSGVPAGSPDVAIFFTRWITHFCAPAFAFFAGTSAYLYGEKIGNKGELAKYLFTRGLLLVILEFTLLRFFWAFHVDFSEFILAGVIWMLGGCMILLSALIWLSPRTVGIVGLVIILFQQLFAYVPTLLPEDSRASFGRYWEFIYSSGMETFPGVSVLYVLVPWIGVMAAGYGFGLIIKKPAELRNKFCYYIGGISILVFLVVGSVFAFRNENELPFILRLLNQQKYPASQLYLLMTLGPIIALIPFAERVQGSFVNALKIFGRVPMFYYLAHIPLIHISALLVNFIRTGNAHSDYYNTAPYTFIESAERWGLGLLYLVFVVDVVLLYFACRWFEKYKATNKTKKWLRYI